MYILFEGIDTCGKSTQINKIAQKHPEAIITKEPGGTSFGKEARRLLLSGSLSSKRAELLLFLADRAEHYEELICPNRDKLILSDRGFLSGIGYALSNKGVSLEELIALNHFALRGDWPDRIIFFETDKETLKKRLDMKSTDKIEERGIDYLLSVQENMKHSIPKLGIDYLIINARETIDTIYQRIITYLQL